MKEITLSDAEYKKLLGTAKKRSNGRGEDVAQEALANALASFDPAKGTSLYRYAFSCLRSANCELLKHSGFSEHDEGGKKYYVREEFFESDFAQGDDISLLDLAESAPHYDRIICKSKNGRRSLHE